MEARDKNLIRNCLDGQVDAFGELIAPYQDRLYNTLFRMSGNPEDAAELFQESMIRVFRGLRSYQGDSSFYTWLYRIILNVAFTHRRKHRLRVVRFDAASDAGSADVADPGPDTRPGRAIENRETREVIEHALADVPEVYRAVLVLKDVEGLKYEEIAEILDIPIGTVRSRLHRARCEMRVRLQPLLDRGTI